MVVCFGCVRVRDAPAVAALLDLSMREAERKGVRRSEVSNEDAIGHLVVASGILLFLDKVLLPPLEKKPCTNQPFIEALEDCATQLRNRAEAIGGTFQTQAQVLCNSINGYNRCTPVQMPEGLMNDAIRRMQALVKSLLDSTCTIRDMDKFEG